VALAAIFYGMLPAETAYHFNDGVADRWTSPAVITAWMLVPQLFFTLLALGIIRAILYVSARFQQTESGVIRKVVSIMGNMVALPQSILGFAMLDIFSYNSYGIHLLPLWVFAAIIMGLGGIILGMVLVSAIRQIR